MQNILRIDMGGEGGPAASLDTDHRYAGLAGRAVTSLLVAEEVDPACHPLGGQNKLVLAPAGPGAAGSGVGAVSVGCKSPLDGGIVASASPGPGADALLRLGYRAVVLEGQPPGDDVWTVVIDEGGVAFAVENGLRMVGNLETIARLRNAHGAAPALFTIGPAGELGLGAASLTSPERGLRPAHCGLGGAGAVLGSKRVKAIVVAGGGAAAGPEAGPEGEPDDPRSPYREACGIRDPVVLHQLAELADDLGLDAAEIAAAVSLAMEAGLARAGDGQAALRLVEEVARGSPLGRIVGSGLRATAEAFGLEPRIARWRLEPPPDARRGAPALAVATGGELGDAARRVLAAERTFLARARAAAAEDDGRDGAARVRPHPIVFGHVDDDVARLFGAADPDADPFDPQLQLHVGLRAPRSRGPGVPGRLGSRRRPPDRN